MAKSWYVFIGNGSPEDPLNYYRLTVKHECLCGDKICAIYAAGTELHPIGPFSFNIQQYIRDAMVTGQIQPELPAAKKYVYLKY